MISGALSCKGFYMTIVDGPENINGPKYCQIYQAFLSYAQTLYPDGFILQQLSKAQYTDIIPRRLSNSATSKECSFDEPQKTRTEYCSLENQSVGTQTPEKRDEVRRKITRTTPTQLPEEGTTFVRA